VGIGFGLIIQESRFFLDAKKKNGVIGVKHIQAGIEIPKASPSIYGGKAAVFGKHPNTHLCIWSWYGMTNNLGADVGPFQICTLEIRAVLAELGRRKSRGAFCHYQIGFSLARPQYGGVLNLFGFLKG